MSTYRNCEREGLLSATVNCAVELLRVRDLEQSIPSVLQTIGAAAGVDRMQLLQLVEQGGKRVCARHYGWHAPGVPPAKNLKSIVNCDVIANAFRPWAEKNRRGEIVAGAVESFPPPIREFFASDAVLSVVAVPVFVDGEWWGIIGFDSCKAVRNWLPDEIDVLKMLAEVVGTAIERTRTHAELADAKRIIDNSPTILYRLSAEADFPLTYISPNIERYGYTAEELLANPARWSELVDPADIGRVVSNIQSMVHGDTSEASADFRLIKPDGSRVWFDGRAKAIRHCQSNVTAIEGIASDITERKQAAAAIEKLARTDILTGLANRSAFLDRLGEACGRAGDANGLLAVHFVDLDGFKLINDRYGHPVGDELLRAVAQRLTRSVRESDIVARFGGDEFAVLQVGLPSVEFAETTAQSICRLVRRPYKIGGKTMDVGASIGLECGVAGNANADDMMVRADRALYRAKADGRNCVCVYDPALDTHSGTALASNLRSKSAA
jgi:diguanylate cyclase (GGDEF)-like protein/PAS domain S-box-containing protein